MLELQEVVHKRWSY